MQEILIKAGCYIAIILLGYTLRQTGFFGPEAFGVLSKVVIKITLPAAIVASCAAKPIDASLLTISALDGREKAGFLAKMFCQKNIFKNSHALEKTDILKCSCHAKLCYLIGSFNKHVFIFSKIFTGI